MAGYLTDVAGIKVGHITDEVHWTGLTAVVFENGVVCGVDVRGNAPGTRETDLLAPEKTVESIHAILLSGGSAYGLEASSGAMAYLEERGVGLPIGPFFVPIVTSAVIFDLFVGDGRVRPGWLMGYDACANAVFEDRSTGNVGAGTGASIGKRLGLDYAMKGGLGQASVQVGELVVSALVVVNAMGDVYDPKTGVQIAGIYDRDKKRLVSTMSAIKDQLGESVSFANTTIGVVATNGRLTKAQCKMVASSAHDGLARTINPVHTQADGDTLFVVSTGEVEVSADDIAALGAEVVEKAVLSAVRSAESIPGYISWQEL